MIVVNVNNEAVDISDSTVGLNLAPIQPGERVTVSNEYESSTNFLDAYDKGYIKLVGTEYPVGLFLTKRRFDVSGISTGPVGPTGPSGTSGATGPQGTTDTSFQVVVDGNKRTITTGEKNVFWITFNGTISEVILLGKPTSGVSGSIQIDIWKSNYLNYPPTVTDSITSSTPPSIVSGIKSKNSTLTGWNKSLYIGDIVKFNIDSVDNITNVTVIVRYLKI